MTEEQKIQKLTQDVYLTRFNRFVDGIPTTFGGDEEAVTDTDALEEITKTVAWTNMWIDELERETDTNGTPINWGFAREDGAELGTVTDGMTELELDDDILRPVYDENRPLTISFDGTVVSHWEVVAPNQITKRSDRSTSDRVTFVNRKLIFSRAFKDTEVGGTVVADVINSIPRLVHDTSNDIVDASMLDIVTPYQLIVLGVAKNATLPDIVQGGLSPSFVQRYGDLLQVVKQDNQNSSTADDLVKDDLGYIGGVY